jgi:ssDNA-binding Zn-finger/Zn-ribbon topoisomerase 1
MDDTKLIQELLDKLIKSDSDPGEIHICPICEGELHVWFGAYKRGNMSLFGVTVKCKSCGFQMAVDYGVPPPQWAKHS